MRADEWQKVKAVFGEALKVSIADRPHYIAHACHGEQPVHREVVRLLDSFDEAFLEEPALAEIAKQVNDDRLVIGETLGHYRIISLLGSGGMGEVYLAEDTKLGRKVALKILSPDSVLDPAAGRRLVREAKAAAALYHPNIGTVHEVCDTDGYKFIVMQYIRGETLADKLARRPIPASRAVAIATQIADALAEAHSHGVIHRDIKPSNIMIDALGSVKVLDFGLAKRSVTSDIDSIETLFSQPGMILGTISYMSPEQARGKAVDFRTDIWSLGVLVYEMVTGDHPFAGETASDTIAAILKSDVPPMNSEGLETPARLEAIVRKALRKDAGERFQTIAAFMFELQYLVANELSVERIDRERSEESISLDITQRQEIHTGEIRGLPTGDKKASFTSRGRILPKSSIAVTSLIICMVVGFALWYLIGYSGGFSNPGSREAPEINPVISWKLDLEEILGGSARFSPDGKFIAYASGRNGASAIWIKQVAGGAPYSAKQDSWPERSPIFSPDSDHVAFLSTRGSEYGIWTRPVLGGSPTLLSKVDRNVNELLAWSGDGNRIIFATANDLFYFDQQSKQIERLLNVDLSSRANSSFAVSSDGESIAYTNVQNGRSDIWAMRLDGSDPVRVTDDEFKEGNVLWHPDGKRIIYDSVRNGISQIYICGINGGGPELLLSSDVSLQVSDISADGTKLLYYSQKDASDLWNVSLADSRETRLTDSISTELWPQVSSDGTRIVYQDARSNDPAMRIVRSTIILKSLSANNSELELQGDGYLPTWSPDNAQIAFLRSGGGKANLWTVPSVGGEARPITNDGVTFSGYGRMPFNRLQAQDFQWTPDGKSIVYCARPGEIPNLWQAAADGSGAFPLTSNAQAGVWFLNPSISPDGASIAFLKLELGPTGSGSKKWSVWVHRSGSTDKLIETESAVGILGWDKSGRELIVKSMENAKRFDAIAPRVDLSAISAETGYIRRLESLNDIYFDSIILSPDKSALAYVKRANSFDSLHVRSLSGADRTVLTSDDERVYFAGLAWAPNGKSVFFAKQSNWQIISILGNIK